ncbi:MAG: chemotaxis protein CheY [Anaerolineae bacterium SG8_19]|jgi:two-component system response regulator VicR|nr:MAG: chemotaxis protein CheY [Anaerolineae bacterium SG8_19]HCB49440.1 two-component system response regulator [Chloroflexota bacterium]
MAEDEKTILCIEDEREMIELFKIILGRRGYRVSGALGGEEGIQRAEELEPDLILLDLMMPGLDGWEVLQRMRADEKLQKIPIIIVTAKSQEIDRVLALHVAQVNDYVTKPFGPQDLIDSVNRVLVSKSAT